MTESEAIEEIKSWTGILLSLGGNCTTETAEAQELAIKALEEIQQYRVIGTLDECNDARKRQWAKKPKGRYKTRYAWDGAYCPMCACGITSRWDFCQECGQAIDWGKEGKI